MSMRARRSRQRHARRRDRPVRRRPRSIARDVRRCPSRFAFSSEVLRASSASAGGASLETHTISAIVRSTMPSAPRRRSARASARTRRPSADRARTRPPPPTQRRHSAAKTVGSLAIDPEHARDGVVAGTLAARTPEHQAQRQPHRLHRQRGHPAVVATDQVARRDDRARTAPRGRWRRSPNPRLPIDRGWRPSIVPSSSVSTAMASFVSRPLTRLARRRAPSTARAASPTIASGGWSRSSARIRRAIDRAFASDRDQETGGKPKGDAGGKLGATCAADEAEAQACRQDGDDADQQGLAACPGSWQRCGNRPPGAAGG